MDRGSRGKKRPMVQKDRVHYLKDRPAAAGPVVYWMSWDQRSADNWARLYAQERAMEAKVPLIVPITLLNHYVRKYDQQYLHDQVYLNPHPMELHLRNHT
jgi:hypothetical protein